VCALYPGHMERGEVEHVSGLARVRQEPRPQRALQTTTMVNRGIKLLFVPDAQGVIECTRENPGSLKVHLCTAQVHSTGHSTGVVNCCLLQKQRFNGIRFCPSPPRQAINIRNKGIRGRRGPSPALRVLNDNRVHTHVLNYCLLRKQGFSLKGKSVPGYNRTR
jgi:hypothetical protein